MLSLLVCVAGVVVVVVALVCLWLRVMLFLDFSGCRGRLCVCFGGVLVSLMLCVAPFGY